jgi:hypothetical protein
MGLLEDLDSFRIMMGAVDDLEAMDEEQRVEEK